MTLNDLMLLLRHYIRWAVIVPLLCALLLGGFVAARDAGREASYSALSSLSVADITDSLSESNLMLLLSSTAQNAIASVEGGDVSIAIVADDKAQSIKFTATAPTASAAENAANDAAEATMNLMKRALADQASVFRAEGSQESSFPSPDQQAASSKAAALEACVYTIVPAATILDKSSNDIAKYAAVGLAGGFCLVLLALVLFDVLKHPIKSRKDVADVTECPVINGDGGPVGTELAYANILTACKDVPRDVCVIAMGGKGELFAQQLAIVFESMGKDTKVGQCAPPSLDVEGYFAAQRADATLVCVARWRDAAVGLASVLEELRLARANVVGIALV